MNILKHDFKGSNQIRLTNNEKNRNFPTQSIHDNNKTPEFHINALCKFNLDHVPTGYK